MLAIGVAMGLAVPPALAQSDAPKVQKWEQYCQRTTKKNRNATIKTAVEPGYELVYVFYPGGRLLCFRRPAR